MKIQKLLLLFFSAALLLCWPVILSLPKEVFAFTLPDTGQTKCYDTAGAVIPCSGTGQDGAYNINPMSYTDNGNGTITDNVTGLMWQKGENATTYNWYQASGIYDATNNPTSQNVCGSLTLGGQSGWRLPAKKELITIVDYSIPSPGPTINTTYFPNASAYSDWSSTTSADYTDHAWGVYFYNGIVNDYYKSDYGYVRCVRGGQSSSPSLTDNGNGTVTDNGTGLMWQQAEPGRKTWADALTYCEGLSLGGQTDWRLPNIKELGSITDDTKLSPAIDTAYFPNTYADGYWSSTTSAGSTSGAWVVPFGNGGVYSGYRSSYVYVRCIRGGQTGSLCNLTISPSSQTFTSSASTGSVTVTASRSSCAWTASSALSWATITSGPGGTGNGTVVISVSPNTTGATRTGNITIADKTFMITQSDSIFADVASTNAFYRYISAIYNNNPPITLGCSQNPLMYCPDNSVTRGQMAAFIIRAKYGENSIYTLTPYFSDVSATNGFFKYVQKMKDAGITSVTGSYDVNGTVTRGQMAAFIIRAKYGENFTYTTTPYFSDVPATNGFFKYVQKMKDAGITSVTGTYNVNGTVTRSAMAAFIARAFLNMP